MDGHSGYGDDRQKVNGEHAAARHLLRGHLRPATRRRAEVDNRLTRTEQLSLESISRSLRRAIALLARRLDVVVGDVPVQPLLARFHEAYRWSHLRRRADGKFMTRCENEGCGINLLRVLVLGGVLLACRALGAQVEIPVRVSVETLSEALATQLAAASYREGPCRYLKLGTPIVHSVGARLRLAVPGSGALGVAMGDKCQIAADWRGTMLFTLMPYIDGSGRVRVRIVDSRLADAAV